MALLLGAAICLTTNVMFAQSLIWQKHYTANSKNDNGTDVHVGGDGRVYTCGGTADVKEALVISYTNAGTQNWAVSVVGGSVAGGTLHNAITTYGSGSTTHIYAVGQKYVGGTPYVDALIAGYNQGGTPLSGFPITWNCSAGGYDAANAIVVDASENIYVLVFSNTAGGDITVLKYPSTGGSTPTWVSTYNSSGTQSDQPQFMILNSAGTYLYIAGFTVVGANSTIARVIKMRTSDGSYATINGGWVASYDNNTTDIDYVYSLVLGRFDDVYAVGTTKSTSNGRDALLLKYTSAGSLSCSNIYNNSTYNLDDEFASVAFIAPADVPEIYVTGYTTKNAASCDGDYLTRKYDGLCSMQWSKTYTGSSSTCPTQDYARMVKISPNTSKVYVTGNVGNSTQDWATVRYNSSTGAQEWAHAYDRGSAQNQTALKYPLELGWDACHNYDFIYVTGWTYESGTILDATTIQYSNTLPACEGPEGDGGRFMQDSEGSALSLSIKEVGISPNPFNNYATVKFSDETIYFNASFTIYDMMGKEVKRIENINTNEIQIDREDMTDGIYFYRYMQGEDVLSSGKFIITD